MFPKSEWSKSTNNSLVNMNFSILGNLELIDEKRSWNIKQSGINFVSQLDIVKGGAVLFVSILPKGTVMPAQ